MKFLSVKLHLSFVKINNTVLTVNDAVEKLSKRLIKLTDQN